MHYRLFVFFWKIWFHVYLVILFWNLFYSVQNDVDSKFVYFALLVYLFYLCIFIWPMLDQFLLLDLCFYYLFIKITPFLPWSFNAFSCLWFIYYLVFFFFLTVLIDACLSKILLWNARKSQSQGLYNFLCNKWPIKLILFCFEGLFIEVFIFPDGDWRI